MWCHSQSLLPTRQLDPPRRMASTACPDARVSESTGGKEARSPATEAGTQRRTATDSHRLWYRFRVTLYKAVNPSVAQSLICKIAMILSPSLGGREIK